MLALLLAGLQGCGALPVMNGKILYVMVVTQRQLAWIRGTPGDSGRWQPLVDEYQRLHPDVHVSLLSVFEDQVERELRLRTSRGLGPDLILVRAPMANTLLRAGLIAPVPHSPAMESAIAQVAPRLLLRVQSGPHLAGLPVYDEVTLACYNRSRLLVPPQTTHELVAMAASGHPIGLSIDPYGLWWTVGTQGAEQALMPIVYGGMEGTAQTADQRRQDRSQLTAWLAWLRMLVMESKVDIANGPEELTDGLIKGRLDWIPCFSRTLGFLQAGMGNKLGVTTLPKGPNSPPSPFSTLRVWAFGLDSSARQRVHASSFAQLSVDPMLQRRYVLDSQEVLPVNKTVQMPVASSGLLAALAAAQQQYEASSPLIARPYTLEHLSTVVPAIEAIVQQVMVGSLSPEQGARSLMELSQSTR